MAGIYQGDVVSPQSPDTRPCLRRVVDDRVEFRSFRIGKQIATEEVSAARKNPNGAFRVPREVEHSGFETILSEVVSLIQGDIGSESLYPEEEVHDLPHDETSSLPVPEHVPALDHSGIVAVHRYSCAEPPTEIGAIA